MRWLPVLLLPVALFAAARPDVDSNPKEIARRAVINYQKDQLVSLRYEYVENDDIKSKGVEVSRVVTIAGTPYERLTAKNGQPLTAGAEQHEEQKFQKTLLQREHEIKGQRDNRIRKWKEQTRFLEEAPDAFDFKMLPETMLDGRPTFVLECTPKPGFEPRQDRSKMFLKIQAKAWVDKQDLRIVKLEAETLDSVSIGWILARIGRDTRMELEQMRLPDGNWVLKTLGIDGRARIMVVDNKQLDETVTYSNYQPAPDLKPLK